MPICTRTDCSKANQEQPIEAFRTVARASGEGRRTVRICRVCEAADTKARRESGKGTPGPSRDPEIQIDIDPVFAAQQRHAENTGAARLKREHGALLEANATLQKTLDAIRALEHRAPTVIEPLIGDKSDAVPLFLASDWHIEENVDPLKIHGVNSYNVEIAWARSKRFFQNALRLIQMAARDSTITRAVFAFLGDFYSGSIHEELLALNELGPTYAAQTARDMLSAGIHFLLENSDLEFDFYCVNGNHGRMTHKTMIGMNAANSLETFMFYFLASEFKDNPRVRFQIAAGDQLYAKIFPGFMVRFIHGDQVSYQGGVGGVTIPLKKAIARWDKLQPAQLTCLGHFHQRLDGGDFLVNGSLIGYNAYAQRFGFPPEVPAQQFALIHRKHGKSLVAPVWVTP